MNLEEAIIKVQEFKTLLSKHLVFEKIYLYGSFAKNKNNEYSDIDVAIVVDEDPGDFFTVTPMMWKLRRIIDDRIEPIIINKNHDASGFLEEIIKHGIEI